MSKLPCLCLAALFLVASGQAAEGPGPESAATRECLDCHESLTPGIVADWRSGRHAHVTPEQALARPEHERRISAQSVPGPLAKVVVGCAECHTLGAASHPDSVEHGGYQVHPVVSPADCATCHPVEVSQFQGSKKAHAVGNLDRNPVYRGLVDAITGPRSFVKGVLGPHVRSDHARGETCFACHGTVVTVSGTRQLEHPDYGEFTLPVLSGWPNQGVGRVNPDGSRGSCAACHARHAFSIEIARKPDTCGQCHLEPDVPAYNVWKESKHGNIYAGSIRSWNFSAVPWQPGRHFTAPTCAACHASLLTGPDGSVLAQRSHDFASRLWVRIFGLIYSHPQPAGGDTSVLRNPDGLPLPTTFDGRTAVTGLIDEVTGRARREAMSGVCGACHTSGLVESQLAKLERTNAEADAMVAAATGLIADAWRAGTADAADPFDEGLERAWVRQWLFYANSLRYATAMMGPDYATFKNGWWDLNENLTRMRDMTEAARPPATRGK